MNYDWTDIQTIEKYAGLYEIYSSLLSDRQSQVLSSFLLDDFSLAEIAENIGISRQAVHEHLINACRLLNDFEAKLSLQAKTKKMRMALMALQTKSNIDELKTELEKIIEEI